MELRVVPVDADTMADWQAIHNEIVPTSPLSLDDVARGAATYQLTLGYHDGLMVGNATLRPPQGDTSVATVIVRILAHCRRRGFGSRYLERLLADARMLEPRRVETVVLASNADGLRFAAHHGFVECRRYTLDGQSVPFVELYLTDWL